MKNHHRHRIDRRAFSLVELSIVIVILALLIGGIITGRSLIRATELRSVMTDANSYIAAVGNFRTQYRYLPGDMPTAHTYWTTTSGNGDGLVESDERFRFWQQLNLAGFVEKSLSGLTGGGGTNDFVMSGATPNIPDSRIQLAGFGFEYANKAADPSTYAANMGNAFTFGILGAANSGPPLNAVFTPADAATIDTKMDDGRPSTGKWIANLTGGGNFGTATTACTTDPDGSTYTGGYNTTIELVACSFYITSGY